MGDGLPSHCQVALKEWASVLIAMARGEQLVLIRKGGLIEPSSGFELLSEVFVLYPTFEHQTIQFVRKPYDGYLEEARATPRSEGEVQVELCGRAVFSTLQQDPTMIKRLERFHIYNDEFPTQRLKWHPDQPLVVTVVRTFRLPSPQRLPLISRYTGCKSWVTLDHAVRLEGATPVLDDQTFEERFAQIRTILSPAASSAR